MDEIFEVDAAAVLCQVSVAAVAHWKRQEKRESKALHVKRYLASNTSNGLLRKTGVARQLRG